MVTYLRCFSSEFVFTWQLFDSRALYVLLLQCIIACSSTTSLGLATGRYDKLHNAQTRWSAANIRRQFCHPCREIMYVASGGNTIHP